MNSDSSLKFFKRKEDRWPVVIFLSFSVIDLAAYFFIESPLLLGIFFVLMVIPHLVVSIWNHHHSHYFTFKQPILNRILELFYALQSGVSTYGWVLHHNLGHHHHFLDQTKDQSGWARKDGTTMSRFGYGFNVFITSYYRAIKNGKNFPKPLPVLLKYAVITFSIVGVLVWYKPLAGVMVFLLPMCLSLFLTALLTYEHHAGLHTDDPYEGCYNVLNPWFNFLSGNLGYHTAHHLKQGVHWSDLPELHEEIKHRIPDHLFINNFLGFNLPKFGREFPDATAA